MTDTPVDRGAITVWRLEAAFGGVVIAVVAATVLFTSRLPAAFAIILLPVLVVIVIGWVAWYPPARHAHLGWRLDGAGIIVREGIFWRSESAIARVRIQHTDVYQGPLQRHFGIATLKLYTAGSNYTKTELPGLAHTTALALRDELQRDGGTDGGDSDAI